MRREPWLAVLLGVAPEDEQGLPSTQRPQSDPCWCRAVNMFSPLMPWHMVKGISGENMLRRSRFGQKCCITDQIY